MSAPTTPYRLGVAALARIAFAGDDMTSVKLALIERAEAGEIGAMMDVATILQIEGKIDDGIRLQNAALDVSRTYRTRDAAA